MKKFLFAIPVLLVAAAILWGFLRKSDPPKVNFAIVKRQTLVSTLPTNGKVEPWEWQAVRAETGGMVSTASPEDGQPVAAGTPLAGIVDPTLAADVAAAESRLNEARANLDAVSAGGRPAEFTEIDNSLARARLDRDQAKKTLASLERLIAQHAATTQETDQVRDKLQQLDLEIAGLENRRRSLVSPNEVNAARARVATAESALALARQRSGLILVRAPIAGVVYGREARKGSYVNPGDLIANVGRMDRLRVRVFVDEPELGRVAVGQPVTITWDALPGRQWTGQVEKKPVSVQPLGSRQVGEVVCSIANEGGALVPGTNINAEIRTAVVDNALVVPKEALRHDAQGDFVLVLKKENTVGRRPVKKGIGSISQVQVVDGLVESMPVALPSDVPLKDGDRVTPAAM